MSDDDYISIFASLLSGQSGLTQCFGPKFDNMNSHTSGLTALPSMGIMMYEW